MSLNQHGEGVPTFLDEINNNETQEYKNLNRVEEHGLGKQKGKRINEKERVGGEKKIGESKRR